MSTTQIPRTCDRCGLPFHTGGLSAHHEADCVRALRAAYEGAVQAGQWLKRELDTARANQNLRSVVNALESMSDADRRAVLDEMNGDGVIDRLRALATEGS